MKENLKNITRRSFIERTGAVAAGLTILPGSVMSGFGHRAPSDKLNIAVIGIGGMGNTNLKNVRDTENISRSMRCRLGICEKSIPGKSKCQSLLGLAEDV